MSYPIAPSSFSIFRVEDLEGKTPQELWSIFCSLLTTNAALLNTIQQLQGSLPQKNEEINILRGALSDMATLKKNVETLLVETQDLRKQMETLLVETQDLRKQMENFQKELNELKPMKKGLTIRGIGNQVDLAAMKKVFPDALKKPFLIKSLVNLEAFIENPARTTKELRCAPGAADAWNNMEEGEKLAIKINLASLLERYPTLLFSIQTLKSNWQCVGAVTNIHDSIEFFRGQESDEMVDSIELCAKLLESLK